MPTIFIGLMIGTKEVKDRRTFTHLGNCYQGTADSRAFGTPWGTHWRSAVCRALSAHRLNPILLNFAEWLKPGISLEKEKDVM